MLMNAVTIRSSVFKASIEVGLNSKQDINVFIKNYDIKKLLKSQKREKGEYFRSGHNTRHRGVSNFLHTNFLHRRQTDRLRDPLVKKFLSFPLDKHRIYSSHNNRQY